MPSSGPDPVTDPTGWASPRLVSRRGLQVILGCLWLVDAVLQAEPANFSGNFPLGRLAQSVMGAPAWENRLIFGAIRPFAAHWPVYNVGSIVTEVLIGLLLVTGCRARLGLALSIGWALVVWILGEGMGMLPTGFAMLLFGAPGAAMLYAVLSGLAWPRGDARDVSRGWWAATFLTVWAGSAVLQFALVYPTGQSFRANFADTSSGQRPWLTSVSGGVARIAAHDPVAFGTALALVQLAVGVGWLVDRHHGRRWLALGVAVTVLYWLVGQCLGSVLSAGATDVGTGPLLILLCVAGWPRVVAQRTERADERRTQPIEAADRSTVAAISTVKAIPA